MSKNRRTREDIRKLVAAFKQSGLSQAEFARQHLLNANNLSRWIQREDEEPQLVRVNVVPESKPEPSKPLDNRIEVELVNGRVLRVPVNVDASLLSKLIFALERTC